MLMLVLMPRAQSPSAPPHSFPTLSFTLQSFNLSINYMMLLPAQFSAIWLQLLLSCAASQLSAAVELPEYRRLPSLREQAAIQDAWRDERVSRIPHILQKYGVDAWLVCS
jgi:glucose-6-phosphate 1-dehydrogenase